MKVSVLIPTRNRSERLRRTLESLFSGTNLTVGDWEAVVVDNGSTDNTPDLCAAFCVRYPARFHAYLENKKGKSNALNLGISAARGEILAFTDDDVIYGPDYIASIQTAFARHGLDAAQGRIFLDCEGGTPQWLFKEAAEFVGDTDYGDGFIQPFPRLLKGANLVVRAEAARAVGGFAPELGAGASVGFAEDTEFSMKLRWAGYRIGYAPQIVVRHQFPGQLMTKSFFRERYFRMGRSRAYYQPYSTPLWRFGLYVAKKWIFNDAKALRYLLTGRAAAALDCQCEARFQTGFFWQHFLFWYGVPRQLTRITTWPVSQEGHGKPSDEQRGLKSGSHAQAMS